jgi:nitrite reductase (NADH) small subunit
MAFVCIGRLDDIPPLGARRYRRADGVEIAVFRTESDTVFALRDRCPHKGGPLSQGIVFGESVACPLHNWCISLTSGEAVAPDEGRAERYPVRIEAGAVWLDPDAGTIEAGVCASATDAAASAAPGGPHGEADKVDALACPERS